MVKPRACDVCSLRKVVQLASKGHDMTRARLTPDRSSAQASSLACLVSRPASTALITKKTLKPGPKGPRVMASNRIRRRLRDNIRSQACIKANIGARLPLSSETTTSSPQPTYTWPCSRVAWGLVCTVPADPKWPLRHFSPESSRLPGYQPSQDVRCVACC